MLVGAGLSLLGLAMVVVGADRAVRAAAELALLYGVSAFFVGVSEYAVGLIAGLGTAGTGRRDPRRERVRERARAFDETAATG